MPDGSEVIFKSCRICGKQMQIVVPDEDNFLRNDIERVSNFAAHDECIARMRNNRLAARMMSDDEARSSSWEYLCPPEFQKELNPKAPGFHKGRLDRILGWRYGETGLLVRGPTHRCKTRFIYQLLYREHLAGRKVMSYLHSDFRRTISALASSSGSDLARFVIKLVETEILFLDDLGKGKSTPTADESLFSLIDGRNRACRPTLFTMNGTLDTLAANISLEYREPLLSRIRAKTEEIVFA